MLAVSLLLCVLPLLIRGENEVFLKVVTLLIISGWLFIRYPFGGWSHALFHIVVALIPPVMMQSASNLKLSQTTTRGRRVTLAVIVAVTARVPATHPLPRRTTSTSR